MSLLNQVLRDLDRRQARPTAAAAGVGPAPTRPPLPAGRRALRWGVGATFTAAAIVAGGWAQGSIAWPTRSLAGSTASPANPAVVAAPALPVVAAAPAATPVPTVDAPPPVPAPSAPPAEARIATAPVALPAPAARPARVTPTPPPRELAPAEPPAPRLAPQAEAHIDKRAASRTPQERADAQYQRGVAVHQAGQIDESAAAFAAALREEPRHVAARLAQAGVLIGQSRHDEALALLQEGIALAPTQPQLALMLARLQAERQELSAATETLKAASANAAGNAEYQGFQAAILQRANRHGEAVEKFSAALRLAPGHSVWWMGLGISLAASGQADAAREAFTRAKATGGLPVEAGLYVDARLRQLL